MTTQDITDTASLRLVTSAVAAIDHLSDRLHRAGIRHETDYPGNGVTIAPRSPGGALSLLVRLCCRSPHRVHDPEGWQGRTPGGVTVLALIDTTGRGATQEAGK